MDYPKTFSTIKTINIPNNKLLNMQFYFNVVGKDSPVFCEILKIKKNKIHFVVVNGGWGFVFNKQTGRIIKSKTYHIETESLQCLRLFWMGYVKNFDYNLAISKIKTEIKNGYCMSVIDMPRSEIDTADIPF